MERRHRIEASYCMQNGAGLIGGGYAIFECFANSMRFPRKLLEKVKLSGNYDRMSLHAFIACVHSIFPGEEALKACACRTNWDPVFNTAILDKDRRKREKMIG